MRNLKEVNEQLADVTASLKTMAATVEKENRTYTPEETARVEQDLQIVRNCQDEADTIKRNNDILALSVSPVDEEREVKPDRKAIARSRDFAEKEKLALRAQLLTRAGAGELVRSSWLQAAHDVGADLNSDTFTIQRNQSVGTNSEGGYLGTPSLYEGLEKSLKYYSGISNWCEVATHSDGRPRLIATMDDTANTSATVSELGTATNTSLVFGLTTVNTHKVVSMVQPISNESIADLEEDIMGLVSSAIAERIGRQVAVDTTTGNLTNDKGFITLASNSSITAASQTVPTFAELLSLRASLDWSYRNLPGAGFFCNSAGWDKINALADSTGQPLLKANFYQGQPPTLDGSPVYVVQGMASPATGTKAYAFGVPSKFYFRQVGSMKIKVLSEIYAEDDAVGVIGVYRFGSYSRNTASMKYMLMA